MLLNKCDLDPAEELYRIYTAAGFPTLRISAETGEGLEELIPLITGKLSAFTGNSGVGGIQYPERAGPGVPAKDRGDQHGPGPGTPTTRHVELFRLSCGAEIMDSPGFSSFETEELNLELKHRLPETFREFAPYLGSASFWIAAIPRKRGAPCGKRWKRGSSSPAGIRVICACSRN